jgi:hypothetical protein
MWAFYSVGFTGSHFGLWHDADTMPRWASRLIVEIEAVRVEALTAGEVGKPPSSWVYVVDTRRVEL